jgi:hypothetical protein
VGASLLAKAVGQLGWMPDVSALREQARSHIGFLVLVVLGINLIRNQSLEKRHFWLFRGVLSDEPVCSEHDFPEHRRPRLYPVKKELAMNKLLRMMFFLKVLVMLSLGSTAAWAECDEHEKHASSGSAVQGELMLAATDADAGDPDDGEDDDGSPIDTPDGDEDAEGDSQT